MLFYKMYVASMNIKFTIGKFDGKYPLISFHFAGRSAHISVFHQRKRGGTIIAAFVGFQTF